MRAGGGCSTYWCGVVLLLVRVLGAVVAAAAVVAVATAAATGSSMEGRASAASAAASQHVIIVVVLGFPVEATEDWLSHVLQRHQALMYGDRVDGLLWPTGAVGVSWRCCVTAATAAGWVSSRVWLGGGSVLLLLVLLLLVAAAAAQALLLLAVVGDPYLAVTDV